LGGAFFVCGDSRRMQRSFATQRTLAQDDKGLVFV
jgi:hypothetical protein